MPARSWLFVALAASLLAFQSTAATLGADPRETAPEKSADPAVVRQAIERSLVFLQQDTVKWRQEKKCATCHHGAITVWTMNEAKAKGLEVDAGWLAEVTQWTKDKFAPPVEEKPDLRPGYNMPGIGMAFLALSGWTNPDALAKAERHQIAHFVIVRQQSNGAWLIPPAKNSSPTVNESEEVMAMWFYLALELSAADDSQDPAAARASREKAEAWLARTPPADTTQSAALRLLLDVRAGKPAEQLQGGIEKLLARQNPDGGFSQIKDLASDAHATGQSLYVLRLAGVASDRPEVRRAAAFLTASQREDGSWPMTPRETAARKSKFTPPIVHFGSAWATLGLLRTLPE